MSHVNANWQLLDQLHPLLAMFWRVECRVCHSLYVLEKCSYLWEEDWRRYAVGRRFEPESHGNEKVLPAADPAPSPHLVLDGLLGGVHGVLVVAGDPLQRLLDQVERHPERVSTLLGRGEDVPQGLGDNTIGNMRKWSFYHMSYCQYYYLKI